MHYEEMEGILKLLKGYNRNRQGSLDRYYGKNDGELSFFEHELQEGQRLTNRGYFNWKPGPVRFEKSAESEREIVGQALKKKDTLEDWINPRKQCLCNYQNLWVKILGKQRYDKCSAVEYKQFQCEQCKFVKCRKCFVYSHED